MLLTMFLFQKWLGSPFPEDVWATPASVHSLWSSPKCLNRLCLTVFSNLRSSLLLVHIFLPNFFLPVNFAFNMFWYSHCYETGPCLASSHHQRSPSPILPDSFTHLHTPVHLFTHTQLLPILMAYLNTTLPPLCLSVFFIVPVSVLGLCLPFCLLNQFNLHLDPDLVLSTALPSVPWQNTDSKHGSSRESSALWSDYRLSEDGPWDLSSSHSKGADGKPSEVNGSAPAGDRGRRFCPDILDFGGRAKL